MKRFLLIVVAAFVALTAAPATPTQASDEEGPDRVYFDVTGHYLEGEFLDFWREYGGIQTFGYPLTPVFVQDGLAVQYFERHVLEMHPDNPDDYRVLLRRLGAEARDARDLGHRWPFEPHAEEDSDRFFPATQQNLSHRFAEYWEDNGGTRIFGYPLSSQFRHHGTRVQFTERAIFEHHPDHDPEWEILFERLGAHAAERDGVDTSAQEYDGSTPHYDEDLWQTPEPEPAVQSSSSSSGSSSSSSSSSSSDSNAAANVPARPSELRIDRIGVRSSFEHLGRNSVGAMADPVGWDNVSWFNEGPRPGQQGNAAVAGHLDRPGGAPAAFWNLRQLQPGDRVTVITEANEELVFEVTHLEQFHISNPPTSRIFGRTDGYNMNLITCAGNWDTSIGMYDQRLVAYTTLVSR
jgi:sortase (surface protein transpeptidase)